jgi:hypothetical protein
LLLSEGAGADEAKHGNHSELAGEHGVLRFPSPIWREACPSREQSGINADIEPSLAQQRLDIGPEFHHVVGALGAKLGNFAGIESPEIRWATRTAIDIDHPVEDRRRFLGGESGIHNSRDIHQIKPAFGNAGEMAHHVLQRRYAPALGADALKGVAAQAMKRVIVVGTAAFGQGAPRRRSKEKRCQGQRAKTGSHHQPVPTTAAKVQ